MIRIYTKEEIDNIIQTAYDKGKVEGFETMDNIIQLAYDKGRVEGVEAGIEQMEYGGY